LCGRVDECLAVEDEAGVTYPLCYESMMLSLRHLLVVLGGLQYRKCVRLKHGVGSLLQKVLEEMCVRFATQTFYTPFGSFLSFSIAEHKETDRERERESGGGIE